MLHLRHHLRREEAALSMAKKLHIEITPANWERMKEYVDLYNDDPQRVTPKCKPADVINRALHEYLAGKRG